MEVRTSPDDDGARDEVERLAEEFLERLRRGEHPGIEEYVTAHPQHAEAIRGLFSTLVLVEDFGASTVSVPRDQHAPGGTTAAGAAPRAPPELKQLGEFTILREIGRGGMGIVYEAEQASLGRRVALKVLPFHFLLDAKRLERFQHEARAAARLSHPNIVPVFGVGEHLGLHYYFMQLIPGQGLNHVIEEIRRQRRALGPEAPQFDESSSTLAKSLESPGSPGGREGYFHNIARLIRDAALALDYAHVQGILHRDVKPSNLLLDPAGRVWLTDFGLAKAEGAQDITHTGDFVGTMPYMAPERFKGWSDPRSDVYALGVTLYELLTLQPIFHERSRAELLRKISEEEPAAPRAVDRSIPRDLETVVLKAIAKEPAHRYGNARTMADDLGRFLTGKPVEARRSSVLERWWRWCARNRLVAGGLVTILLLLLTTALVSTTLLALLSGEQGRLRQEQIAGKERLRSAYASEASALRASAQPGRRFDALDALQRAAAIRPGDDLVDEALACFALVDLRSTRSIPKRKNQGLAVSPDGKLFALHTVAAEISIRQVEDEREVFRLTGPSFQPAYTFVSFSRDSRFLAARFEKDTTSVWRVWAVADQRLLVEVNDGAFNNGLDFGPGGAWLVVTPRSGNLRFIDLGDGSILEETGQGMSAHYLAVHPGGRLIAFVSDRTRGVHLLDRVGAQGVRQLHGTSGLPLANIAWHPAGELLAAASLDHLVYLWNAESGALLRVLRGHSAEVVDVTFSPDGEILVSGSWDPNLQFWDPAAGVSLFSIPSRAASFVASTEVCWAENGNTDSMLIWELKSRLPVFTLHGHTGEADRFGQVPKHPVAIALDPTGRLAATCGTDGVRLWDLVRREELCHLGEATVSSVFFNPAGTALYGSGVHGLHRWPLRDTSRGQNRLTIGPAERLGDLDRLGRAALGQGGRKLAVYHESGHVHVFDPEQKGSELELEGVPPGSNLELSSDGRWIATGSSASPRVLLWDLTRSEPAEAAQPARQIPAEEAFVRFHPNARQLAVSTPAAMSLWNVWEERPVWQVEREPGLRFYSGMAFDQDGRILAATHSDTEIWLLDASTGKRLSTLAPSDGMRIIDVAFVGGRLAACTYARRFHVWDLNALTREVDQLGLRWNLQVSGPTLAELPRKPALVVDDSPRNLRQIGGDLASRKLFRPHRRVAFQPRIQTYRELDIALDEPELTVREGDTWRYFGGRTEPSEGTLWTEVDFDDTTWPRGASPLTSWGHFDGFGGTGMVDQTGHFTTLYLRRELTFPDPRSVQRLSLEVEVEDGFVAFLNGREVGRVNAGRPGERLPCTAVAPSASRSRTVDVVEIDPGLLEVGKNVLALQVLTFGPQSRVHALPVLASWMAPSVAGDERRTEPAVSGDEEPMGKALQLYRRGRILARTGIPAQAIENFERAMELDPAAAEPILRSHECLRILREHDRAADLIHKAIERPELLERGRLWFAWFLSTMVDMKRSPTEALKTFPGDPGASGSAEAETAANYRWLLTELSSQRAVRINCGGGDHVGADGKVWSRDRFYRDGSVPEARALAWAAQVPASDLDLPLEGSYRYFLGPDGGFQPAYRIPLPPGLYRVKLHFVLLVPSQPRRRVFDILLNGKVVRAVYDLSARPAGSGDVLSFELEVKEGALEIDFVRHKGSPEIAALEVEALE